MNIEKKITKVAFLFIAGPLLVLTFSFLFFPMENIFFPFYKDFKAIANEEMQLKYTIENHFSNKNDFEIEINMDDYKYFDDLTVVDSNNLILNSTIFDTAHNMNDFDHYIIHTLEIKDTSNNKIKLLLGPSPLYKKLQYKKILYPITLILAFLAGVSLTVVFFIKKISKNIIKPLKIIDESFNKIHRGNYSITFPKFNVTEIENIADNLEKLTLELKENENQHYQFEQSRKELIAKITHDLKTPLTSIKGYIEALEDNINNDETAYFKYLEIINEKSDKLNLLIDDLLLFSQLDLDNFTYDKRQVDSKEFIENFASSKLFEFNDKNIDFVLKRPIIATNIFIDPKRMLQVLENIVSNAKKFTKNYIAISTSISASYLIINIEDNGIGIDLKHQPHIFELFYKTDHSRSEPSKTGSGLGLNISKQIIEAHGGKITLKSEPNKKTVFSIYIPLMI